MNTRNIPDIAVISEPVELSVVHAGMEQCAPAHAFGPAVRDYYLIHFIFAGRGRFQGDGRTWLLSAGQGFLICPDQVTFYQADHQEPWHYVWIGFQGTRAAAYLHQAGLSPRSPILGSPAQGISPVRAGDADLPMTPAGCFQLIAQALALRGGRELRLLALLHLLLSLLIEQNPEPPLAENQVGRREWYVRQAQDFLEMNYAQKITVGGLARHLGLDRSYFGLLFRQSAGQPPQQYLLHLRLAKACSLMARSSLSIAAVARSVGYDDPLLFSRMFRQVMGCSPSQYRKSPAAMHSGRASIIDPGPVSF